MRIIIIFSLAIAILGNYSRTKADLCGDTQSYIPDVYLSATYVKEFTNIGRKQCIRACHSNMYCWSYSYDKKTFSCYIHDIDSTSSALKADTDFDYGNWYNITKTLAGPCFNAGCTGLYDRCIVLKSGQTKCISTTI